MEPRTAWFCFLCILLSWNPGYPETYHQYIDKNGVKCFSNSLRRRAYFQPEDVQKTSITLRLNCNGPANKPKSSTGGRWKPKPAL